MSQATDKDLYTYYDPVDVVRHWIDTNWRVNNFFGKKPLIKAVYGVRNIEAKVVRETKIRPYGISASPTESPDATYDFYDKTALVAVDIQAPNRKFLMKAWFETTRSILENRKNPEPNYGWWDLMYIQDEVDRSFEENKIFHWVMDVKLEKWGHSIIDFVNTNESL